MITVEQQDQFVAKLVLGGECWDWLGAHDSDGYGRFTVNWPDQQTTGAHRFAYLWLKGPIPDGLVLDHLEPVTDAENQRRGLNCDLKTHCKHGHKYTPENTIIQSSGRRWCRECRRLHDQRMGQRRKFREWASGKVKNPRTQLAEG